jgi:hypothetical protein
MNMTISVLLPEPNTIEKISLMYSRNRLMNSQKEWLADSPYANELTRHLLNGRPVRSGSKEYDQLNLHLLYRSMHQVNEACNKLWSTAELYYHAVNDKALCEDFSSGFLGSSTVPTLHYANVSALISIMSLFGLGSWINRDRGLDFFNLLRTSNEFLLVKRDAYLRSLLGKTPNGWHKQILETYRGLESHGIALPKLDIKSSESLLRTRSKYHYDVLGDTTMGDIYGADQYFEYLKTVSSSVSSAIKSIHEVLDPIPNGCDKRFDTLRQHLPQLATSYGKSFEDVSRSTVCMRGLQGRFARELNET